MPILSGLLASLFTGLTSFLATWFASKVALALAAIATVALMTIALAAALEGLVAGILVSLPTLSPVSYSIMWMALPDNVNLVVGACISADIFVATFRWGNKNIQLALAV